MTGIDWNKFQHKFGTWKDKIKPIYDSGELDKIYRFLKKESLAGKQITPSSNNTFRAFLETDINELKCVILLQDPYFKFINGDPVASGIAMDCSITARVQPTLQQFYDGIEQELFNGLNLNYINTYDLSYLAKQGVLLLNAALTVEKDKANSHGYVWKKFTEFVLKEIISTTGVPIIFLGKEAQQFMPLVEKTNHCFPLNHPASSGYTGKKWDTKDTFTKVSQIIQENTNDSVLWLNIDAPF